MCLTTCPTYDLTKFERSSPRGRIQLIRAVADGRLGITPAFVDEMNFCLDCQACETACPAGVKYGRMVESARVLIEKTKTRHTISDRIKKIGLNFILTSRIRLRIAGFLLWFVQASGIQKALIKTGLLDLFGKNLTEYLKLLPQMKFRNTEGMLKGINLKPRNPSYKVAFLSGCIMDIAFSDVNYDTVKFLLKNNCEVFIPRGQVCCGSLHAHNGEMDTAVKLMKKNIDIFSSEGYDFLVSNSAGCGAFMKEYGHLMEDDAEYKERAGVFSEKVKDFSEFALLLDYSQKMKSPEGVVTYHDACHLVHSQKISSQPREMLSRIPGMKLVNLHESTWCCGSAGIYNVTRYEDSMKFLEKKMGNIRETKADLIITANPGCMLQIQYGLQKDGSQAKVEHPATLMNRLMREE
ncbi:MAG: (Fe-S)-binding protein [Ignavibacteriaceae bacterium]|nr:(Fe-S)-binding protein [Ignavibacteriaceae bacterium]